MIGAGGVIGIGFWEGAVCDTSTKAIADAIDHVVKIGGIETVALGSDFDGAVTVGLEASQMDYLTNELLKRGYTPAELDLIMGGNTIRVFNDVLPEGSSKHSH